VKVKEKQTNNMKVAFYISTNHT